jgi:hypothetical protein
MYEILFTESTNMTQHKTFWGYIWQIQQSYSVLTSLTPESKREEGGGGGGNQYATFKAASNKKF